MGSGEIAESGTNDAGGAIDNSGAIGGRGAIDGSGAIDRTGSINGSGAIDESHLIFEASTLDGSGAMGAVSGTAGSCPGLRQGDVCRESEAGKTTTRRNRKRWEKREGDEGGGEAKTGDLASPGLGVYARIGVYGRSGASPGAATAHELFGRKENKKALTPMMSEHVAVGSVAGVHAERREEGGEAENDDAEVAFSVEKREGMGRRRPLGPVRRSVELGQLPASK